MLMQWTYFNHCYNCTLTTNFYNLVGRRGLVGLFTTHGAKGRGFESPPRRFLLKNVSFGPGWPKEEDHDHERVIREERGRRRGHSDQERLRERLLVRISNSIKW